MRPRVTRNDYCQFLLVTQTNYTLTYFANHTQNFSHDAPTRYLKRDRVTPEQVWNASKDQIVLSRNGFIIFDDSVLDKNHSRKIGLVYKQYSGNEHRVIRGIGLINCVYVNPETGEFWLIDYRIYDPANDNKDKHEHVSDMLDGCFLKCHNGQLDFRAVLMDTWYATTKLMLKIHRAGATFYCPIKPNRTVSEVRSNAKYSYTQAESLVWNEQELDLGKVVHLKEFPAGVELKLFRVAISTDSSASSPPGAILRARTELIVTNDTGPLNVSAVREAHGWRWKVEQFHREIKGLTGIEACECRSARAQRNHLGCALLAWQCLKRCARASFCTVYALQ